MEGTSLTPKLCYIRFFYPMHAGLESHPGLWGRFSPGPPPCAQTCVEHRGGSFALGCGWGLLLGAPKRNGERKMESLSVQPCSLRPDAHKQKPPSVPCSVAFRLWAPGTAPSFVPSCRGKERAPLFLASGHCPVCVVFYTLPTPLQ